MSRINKDIDSAFQGVGTKSGLEIWCIYNNQLISIHKSSFGKFHSANAYLVLRTVLRKIGSPQYDIHYWMGSDANEVDSILASDKALELDAALGCCTVQYREVQGQETEKFLSYFKPCIIPVEGKYSLPQIGLAEERYNITLLMCKGDHVVRVKEVPFVRSSLNHDDVFVLDTAAKVFLFAGCNSSSQEKAKALEVVEYIKDNKHDGRCQVATIEDGKFSGDSDSGEFWSFFGGYAPIPKISSSTTHEQTLTTSVELFWIGTRGNLQLTGTSSLKKEMLENNKCYMLDCNSEVFVWMGRNTTLTERKTSISASEEFLRKEGRSTSTSLVLLTEGLENARFKSFFDKWPQIVESSLYNEGREKVAAMFKRKGYDVEELPDDEEEEEPLYRNGRDTLKVWRVDGEELLLLSIPDQAKLFSGDCYILQYTYASNERKEHLFYIWIGSESMEQDRADAISKASAIVASTKGESVMCHIYQGNEPARFFAMFKSLVFFKGGLGRRYKMFLVEKAIQVEISNENKASLFRVQGSPRNMQAIQVNLTATSLNSSYCYILHNGASVFTWIGNLSSDSDLDVLDRMVYFLDQTWQPLSMREGNEQDTFWDLLGGKAEYPKEKEMRKQIEEPHLFTFSCISDNDVLKVKEVYNFVQDDLTTEDVLLLDCQSEVYVWIGLNSNIKSTQQALTLALKFLEMDILEEGLTVRTPVYVVTEGHEPPFFTRFFEWVPVKANMHGNSFERKLATLKEKATGTKGSSGGSWRSHSKDNASSDLRSRSVSSNGSERGVSPFSSEKISSLSSVEDKKSSSDSTPVIKRLFSGSPSVDANNGLTRQESGSNSDISRQNSLGGINRDLSLESLAYSYEQLRVDSQEPITDIDATRRETYLTDKEFEERFKMAKSEFYALPKWKQTKLKMSLHLF